MSEAIDFKYVGTRPVRPDGVDKVTGRANYAADFNLPGTVDGLILRSPHAHARILNIDITKALAIDGVLAVVTGDNFPGLDEVKDKDLATNVMARDRVLYHGHAVAAVAAVSQSVASMAVNTIEVEYEVLPALMSMDEALAPDAPILHDDVFTQGLEETPTEPSNVPQKFALSGGDLEKGFAEADVIVEREFVTPTVHQGYIEPHATLATINEGGRATVWSSTQGHFSVRGAVAGVLNMAMDKIKVVPSEIGGGFGGKLTLYLEPVALLLSQQAGGRPVKLAMNREEVFRASGPVSASRARIKMGAKKDGTLTAMQAELWYEAGAYRGGGPMRPGCMCVFAAYGCENFLIEGYTVLVNKPKMAAYRAPGAPQSEYAAESAVDELARELGVDPIELRLKNAVSEGVNSTYGPRWGSIGLKECLEAAKRHPNYHEELGKNEGRGVSVGFWFNGGNQSSAEVHVNENGSVTVVEGSPDIGGSRASMALMCAETLGIPYEDIQVLIGDTDTIGFNDSTGGSRTTFATGLAVIEASRKIIGQLRARAALVWEVDVDQVDWIDGQAVPKPGANIDVDPLTLPDIAGKTRQTGGPINASASLNAQGAGPAFSVNIADVRFDPDTGKVDVLRYTAIQDVGKAVHPSYVEGQMQGGAAQGIGWALNEEYIWDADGKLDNAGFLDYRIPVASDLPMIDTEIVEVANPTHPFGVRGCGETPICAPLAATANAVRDATGVRVGELPISPPRLLAALSED